MAVHESGGKVLVVHGSFSDAQDPFSFLSSVVTGPFL